MAPEEDDEPLEAVEMPDVQPRAAGADRQRGAAKARRAGPRRVRGPGGLRGGGHVAGLSRLAAQVPVRKSPPSEAGARASSRAARSAPRPGGTEVTAMVVAAAVLLGLVAASGGQGRRGRASRLSRALFAAAGMRGR